MTKTEEEKTHRKSSDKGKRNMMSLHIRILHVEIEMVSSNRSAYQSNTVGTVEDWEEKKICWNHEIQSPEEMSTKDNLKGPVGNIFLEYGVINSKRIWKICEPRTLEMEPMMKNASNIHIGVSTPS